MGSPRRLVLDPRRHTCQLKRNYGKEYCLEQCPTLRAEHRYDYVRVERPADLPSADDRIIDVAILDMNHGWPNLGHASLVHAVQDAACDVSPLLEQASLRIRAISFEVRQRHMIPEAPGGRFALYVGTGGPGHIDPHCNDGSGERAQGIREDPAWEPRLFALFDRIRDAPDSALLAVCHSFGVMCRWSEEARPVLRPAAKGGKSAGILEYVLTDEAVRHPWFAQLAESYPGATSDYRLHLTSDYTLMGPLCYYLYRQVRPRAAAQGVALPLDEREMVLAASTPPAARPGI